MTGKRPMLRIPAALEKGNRDPLLPMAPEFAEFLAEARGQTHWARFDPRPRRRKLRLSDWSVGTRISAIGKGAGVKVNADGLVLGVHAPGVAPNPGGCG